ncbi:MAG: zinc-binding dehydrogenase [Chloroflexi bacterium]|nr:zinc-binding dehydrogenase [Chloroflexota bacterium]
MKAAVFFEPGGPEKIQVAEVPTAQFNHNQLLIQVKACSLNHFDLLVLREIDPENFNFPFWGGADIAGIVSEVGKFVDQFKVGDRVVINPSLYCGECEHCLAGEESQCNSYGIIGDTVPGGFAEYIAVDAGNCLKIPESISFEEAAATPLVFQTAWRALMSKANIRPGDNVLILGASGGVGSASIQIAKLAGANVIAVTSNADKMSSAKQIGADLVLNRKSGDYWGEIAALTDNRGVDVVLENIGAATWAQSLKSLVKGGRLVTYGRTTGYLAETDIRLIFWNQLRIIGTTMANRREFSEVMQLIFQRKLNPVIDTVFPLDQAQSAYQRLLDGEHFGKIIIKID